MRCRVLIAGMIGLASAALPAGADDPAITILFHVRPPYAEFGAAHDVTGLLVDPVKAALAKTGLTAEWLEMPPARQTEEIKRTSANLCGLGWFKRPEREAFAQFSAPIYHDRPTVVVARKGDDRFEHGMSLQHSFRDHSREIIVKTGYSYGAVIDEWMKALHPRTEVSSGDNEALLGMVALERADYAIMAPEEADDLLGTIPQLGASLRPIRLADAPDGELRYLMCSKATAPDLIARINEGLVPIAAQ
jgi:polar amino acid transport system substrate-binding protein